MTYSEIIKKENRDGFKFVLLPMVILGLLAVFTDAWIFAVLAVAVFIIGIFAIRIPAETRLRRTFVYQTGEAYDRLSLEWVEGRSSARVQLEYTSRDVEHQFKSLDYKYKRWLVCQSRT